MRTTASVRVLPSSDVRHPKTFRLCGVIRAALATWEELMGRQISGGINARRLRDRAEECRTCAELMEHGDARDCMLRCAADYDQWARRCEAGEWPPQRPMPLQIAFLPVHKVAGV